MNTDFIINTEKSDLNFIYHLFDEAIAYQKRNNYPVWPDYDRTVLIKDIDNKLQYKLVNNDEIAYVFSICYSDKVIWREKDKNDAIYLHRMVVNPKSKGQKRFGKILEWALEHCKHKNLQFIRMDTWADNPNIIDYYKSFGFDIVGNFKTPDSDELPIQQRNNEIVLLEMELRF
jgi:GNAT superfamily N-acetyltransferase